MGSGSSDDTPPSPQFVYVSTGVSAAPLTPPASEYSSDAENTSADNTGQTNTTTSANNPIGYGLIDYVIERSDGEYDEPLPKDFNAPEDDKTTTSSATAAQVSFGSGNKGQLTYYRV